MHRVYTIRKYAGFTHTFWCTQRRLEEKQKWRLCAYLLMCLCVCVDGSGVSEDIKRWESTGCWRCSTREWKHASEAVKALWELSLMLHSNTHSEPWCAQILSSLPQMSTLCFVPTYLLKSQQWRKKQHFLLPFWRWLWLESIPFCMDFYFLFLQF